MRDVTSFSNRASAREEASRLTAGRHPALHRLERRGWLESEWGLSENNRKAKFYRLTATGRAELRAAVADWERYVRAVGQVLRPAVGRPDGPRHEPVSRRMPSR